MACVYILYSLEINSYYVGSCLNFNNRFKEHLNHYREKAFTCRANDWIEFLKIEDLDYQQSRLIELHIKKMKSRVYIENLKLYPELRERLLNQYI